MDEAQLKAELEAARATGLESHQAYLSKHRDWSKEKARAEQAERDRSSLLEALGYIPEAEVGRVVAHAKQMAELFALFESSGLDMNKAVQDAVFVRRALATVFRGVTKAYVALRQDRYGDAMRALEGVLVERASLANEPTP